MVLKMNKCAKPFIITVSFLLITWVIYMKVVDNNHVNYDAKLLNYKSKAFNKTTKTILLWNTFFGQKNWYMPAEDVNETYFKDLNCPATNCIVTTNRKLLKKIHHFDAILFHMAQTLEFKDYPIERSTHQLYIFVNFESPAHTKNQLPSNIEFFNLTLSYRLDSDIPKSYGYIVDKETKQIVAPSYRPAWRKPENDFKMEKKTEEIINNKTRMAAWFVSHCKTISDRKGLASALQEYIDVDIYGACGDLKCSKEKEDCDNKLDSTYKFYLSFENTLCIDYVTEKLFKALNRTIIPIVYGGADYNRFAPPYSYINVEDFDNVVELARYLKFLDSNPIEYRKYFWWKQYYKVIDKPAFCDVCQTLNNPSQREKIQYYKNIEEWWMGYQCRFTAKIKY